MTFPFISCQCITYGRNECLEEAMEFFLRQKYPGRKELVIVNDLPEQTLTFSHPEIRIVNLPERCRTVGDKRNFAVAQCHGDVIVCWDDDDGYLPNHLSECARYVHGFDYARPNLCLVWTSRGIERVAGSFVAQHVFTKDAFLRVGGYTSMNSGQDMVLDRALTRQTRCHWPRIAPPAITYLFRWANGEYHLSGYKRDRPGTKSGYLKIAERVARDIRLGRIETGDVHLTPHFRRDYLGAVSRFLAARGAA